MQIQQKFETPAQIESVIIEHLKKKKELIDKQLDVVVELERITSQQLSTWESKVKNLRYIYNHYNQNDEQSRVSVKEPIDAIARAQQYLSKSNVKNQQEDLQLKQINQSQLIPFVQQPINNERQEKQNQANSQNEMDLEFEQLYNQISKKVPHSKPPKKFVQEKIVEETEVLPPPPNIEKQIMNQNFIQKTPQAQPEVPLLSPKNRFETNEQQVLNMNPIQMDINIAESKPQQEKKILKSPLNNPMKKIVAPSSHSKNINYEKEYKKYSLQQAMEDDDNRNVGLKQFEEHMTRHLLKYKDDSPIYFQQQLNKAIQIKNMLDIPDSKLIITPKWLQNFKNRVPKNQYELFRI